MADVSPVDRESLTQESLVRPISVERAVKAETVVNYAKAFAGSGAVLIEKGPRVDPKDVGERMSLFQKLLNASKWKEGTETQLYLISEPIRIDDPNSNEWYKLSINSLDPHPNAVDIVINKGLGTRMDRTSPVAVVSLRGKYLDVGVEVDNSWHQEPVTFKLLPGTRVPPTSATV
mgnify:CR=1 FL=1